MTRTAAIELRPAGPADAGTLSALGRRTFTDAFAHLYPPADLEAFLADAHSPAAWARVLDDPAQAVWLAHDGGQAVGYAHAGPCDLPHPEVGPDCGELKRLYVLGTAQGGGLGVRLLQTALDWLVKDGPRALWIGVWSQNLGAQRLYARHGFVHVGDYAFAVGESRDHEFILRHAAPG